jgi:hypothetical protein
MDNLHFPEIIGLDKILHPRFCKVPATVNCIPTNDSEQTTDSFWINNKDHTNQ